MRPRFALLSSVAVAALLLASPAFAQQQSTPNPSAPVSAAPAPAPQQAMPNAGQQLSKADRHFVEEAAIGGMAEVALGKLAQQNGQDDQVKQFGARMVQDHSAANNQLQSIANAQGITLPQQLDRKHQEVSDRLSQLHGAAFDRAYMRDMVKDHDEDIRLFRHEAQTSRDPELKQFAGQTLSVIEQHDKMAHDTHVH